jgi:hypothetical protein
MFKCLRHPALGQYQQEQNKLLSRVLPEVEEEERELLAPEE